MTEPLGYIDFLSLTSHARLVLTDSGGLQEESTALGIPCLTLRENTERPATVSRRHQPHRRDAHRRIFSRALRMRCPAASPSGVRLSGTDKPPGEPPSCCRSSWLDEVDDVRRARAEGAANATASLARPSSRRAAPADETAVVAAVSAPAERRRSRRRLGCRPARSSSGTIGRPAGLSSCGRPIARNGRVRFVPNTAARRSKLLPRLRPCFVTNSTCSALVRRRFPAASRGTTTSRPAANGRSSTAATSSTSSSSGRPT